MQVLYPHRTIRWIVAAAAFLALSQLTLARPAAADTIDYVNVAKNNVLKCVHPTVKIDTATAEVAKPTEVTGDTSRTRVTVYYSGLVKKNKMDVDILVRQAGSIRQMKINVLADSSTGVAPCAMAKNWGDFWIGDGGDHTSDVHDIRFGAVSDGPA